jgi:hypothetical protein
MIPTIPWYIILISLTTSLVIAVAVWTILSSAAGRSGLRPAMQKKVRIGTAGFLGGWLGAALLLAPAPETLLLQDPFALTPLVPLFIIAPMSIALLAIGLSPAVRRVIAAASLPAIVGVQLYRVIGVVFVILLAQGQLPGYFALPAGWGDIAVGLSAPVVAVTLARGVWGGRTLAAAWNVFGLVDLAVAVGMGSGFLAPILLPELGTRVAPAPAMGVFPLVQVPMFAVPVSVLLHLIALGRLRQELKLGLGLEPKTAR